MSKCCLVMSLAERASFSFEMFIYYYYSDEQDPCYIYTIICLKSVCRATFADCRSQFLLDRLGRCLKLIVSYRGTSSHEFTSQFGLEFFYTRKTYINYRKIRPSLNCLLNEKRRNAGLAGDRSTVSGKHTRAFNCHSTDRD